MKLPRRIWALTPVGQIALANLGCLLVCGLQLLCLYPEGTYYLDRETGWRHSVGTTMMHGAICLSFPGGWIGAVIPPLVGIFVGVPLNGYLWGWIGQWTWRQRTEILRRRARARQSMLCTCSNPRCSVQFHREFSHCPTCASPPAIEAPDTAINEGPPSVAFVALAGAIAPLICGGIAMACFSVPGLAATLGGLVIGAGFVFGFVRWLNRRDDPRRVSSSLGTPDPTRST